MGEIIILLDSGVWEGHVLLALQFHRLCVLMLKVNSKDWANWFHVLYGRSLVCGSQISPYWLGVKYGISNTPVLSYWHYFTRCGMNIIGKEFHCNLYILLYHKKLSENSWFCPRSSRCTCCIAAQYHCVKDLQIFHFFFRIFPYKSNARCCWDTELVCIDAAALVVIPGWTAVSTWSAQLRMELV